MASSSTPAVYQTSYTTRHDNYARIVNVAVAVEVIGRLKFLIF